jgi:uncharacterized protein YndB with AHSA1/START domain
MKKNEPPVVVEQWFDCQPGKIWNAITRPDQMRQWFFENIPAFDPVRGFETRFDVHVEDRVFPHVWRLIKVIPRIGFTIDWSYSGYPGRAFVQFELFDEGGKTRLKLTHEITEDFPDNIPEFTRESCLHGWTWFIKDSLKNYLRCGLHQPPLP